MAGDEESQDTQTVLDAVKADLGVPTPSGSATQNSLDEFDRDEFDRRGATANLASKRVLNRDVNLGAEPKPIADEPCPQQNHEAIEEGSRHHPTVAVEAAADGVHSQNVSFLLKQDDNTQVVPPKMAAKMDVSQQTPTQINDGRDYNDVCNADHSSPVDNTSQFTHNEPRTLQEDDTGAVNFGNLSELARPSSQVSEDGGFDSTKGEWRLRDNTSQQLSNGAFTPFKPNATAPETPALPKNPFGSKLGVAAPFGGTQMFGQTQQLSSAVKMVSPTSSRPSPNLFLNSISPNIMETSPLKNRANVSSPSDMLTSSPQRIHEVPGTVIKGGRLQPIQEDTPLHGKSESEDLIPESPTHKPPRSSASRQPLAHYEPMKQSQERKGSGDVVAAHIRNDSDSDDAVSRLERRKRMEKKRAMATKEMEKVSFVRLSQRKAGRQSSIKKRRLLDHDEQEQSTVNAVNETLTAQTLSSNMRISQKTVVASAETETEQSTKATPGEESDQVEKTDPTHVPPATASGLGEEDMIPATSPVRSPPNSRNSQVPPASDPELPRLRGDEMELDESENRDSETSSLPPTRIRPNRVPSRHARPRRNPFISSSTTAAPASDSQNEMDCAAAETKATESTADGLLSPSRKHSLSEDDGVCDDTLKVLNVTQGSTSKGLRQTRLQKEKLEPKTPLQKQIPDPTMATSSSLTEFSSTPAPSANTTPGTQQSISSDVPGSMALPSSDAGRTLRTRALRSTMKSESPQYSTKITRQARQKPSSRICPPSTDELQQSLFTGSDKKLDIPVKSSRTARQSFAAIHRTCRLFEGMAFAISLQSENRSQDGCSRDQLEEKIKQAGGIVLQDGFQELFEHPTALSSTNAEYDEDDPLRLSKSGADCGFTALIADGHSRKAKYMQALALGLPCLAYQWVMMCLKRGMVVDWEPFLLCAGSSAVLGNAVRSRTLVPYDATEVGLAALIEQRPRLLHEQRMLVVIDPKKARSTAKRQYVFLAQALGPHISRVGTVEQAWAALAKSHKAGQPFQWLYVDKTSGTAESVLAGASSSRKKRKRAAPTPWVDSLKVLSDELVIQSLILGRMVEEEEMSF